MNHPSPPSVDGPNSDRFMDSIRQLWRDWRGGELRLLAASLVLAVAALAAVGFVAQRLDGALARDAAQLIGGDVVLASDHPIAAFYEAQAAQRGLRHMRTEVFPSMALDVSGDRTRLVSVKAVDAHYPLIGAMQLRPAPTASAAPRTGPPAAGTVWVAPGVLAALHMDMGQELQLGDRTFRVGEVIDSEPDTGGGFIQFAPRVMMNSVDLASTGLIQPASRVVYRLAVAGPEKAVRGYEAWLRARLKAHPERGMRMETVADSGPAQEQTLRRASDFLHLVALITALMAAIAVAQTARDFARRRLQPCAVHKALGLRQGVLLRRYAAEFLWLGLLAAAVGVALGLAAQAMLIALLQGLLPVRALPPPGWQPGLYAGGTGLLLLLAFGMPAILQLAAVPPMAVLRQSLGRLRAAPVLSLAAGVVAFGVLLWLQAGDVKLGLIAAGGFIGLALVMALLGWGAVRLLRRFVRGAGSGGGRTVALAAARQLTTRPLGAVVQITALGLGMLALVALLLMRTSLIDAWRESIPPDAPDRFIINIQPEQAQPVRAALRGDGVADPEWYPMLRGRLVAINGRPVYGRDYDDERARRLIDREFNLSAATVLPAANTIVSGDWAATAAVDGKGLSVEEGIAKSLHFGLGDTLTFEIAGRQVTAPITSVRQVDWSSMHANFFVLMPEAMLAGQPVTYLAAYHAPGDALRMDDALVRQFPNLTVVDVGSILRHLRGLIEQVIVAVEFLFLFALAAGLAVLMASLSLSRLERARDMAIWRAIGASSTLLRRVAVVELLWVGAIAGLLGAAGAAVVSWALAHWVFHFAWVPPWWLWPGAMVAAALLAAASGWWSLRGVLRRAPGASLRLPS